MQIHFTGRNIEVTPALKQFTTEKLQRLERRDATLTKINVTLIVEKTNHIAEATIAMNGTELHAEASATDMYQAIDLLVDKLMIQITKHKEKMTDHHRSS